MRKISLKGRLQHHMTKISKYQYKLYKKISPFTSCNQEITISKLFEWLFISYFLDLPPSQEYSHQCILSSLCAQSADFFGSNFRLKTVLSPYFILQWMKVFNPFIQAKSAPFPLLQTKQLITHIWFNIHK